MLLQMALFHSFLWLSNLPLYVYVYVCVCVCIHICVYIYIPHLLYPFIYPWTFRLLPCLDYCNYSAGMNIGMYVSFRIRVFSGYMPRCGIVRPYGNSIFSFLTNFHTVLHSGFTDLHSHQQCRGFLYLHILSSIYYL